MITQLNSIKTTQTFPQSEKSHKNEVSENQLHRIQIVAHYSMKYNEAGPYNPMKLYYNLKISMNYRAEDWGHR